MSADFIDTRQLEAFAAVMTVGSITGAARRLGKSQPVVTRLIQDLEQDLGFALLRRNGPRITPTEQGIVFFQQTENFLSGLRTISDNARLIAGHAAGPIEIASIAAAAVGVVPQALAALSEDLLPDHVQLTSTFAESVVQAVVARTADIGVASLPLDHPGIEVHWVAEVPSFAVVAATDPLAEASVVRAEDLCHRRLIAAANPYRQRYRIDQAFRERNISPPSVLNCNANYVSIVLARQGLGIAVIEGLTIAGMPLEGLVVRPLDFPVPFRWGVITAAGRPLTRAVERLIEEMERVARESIPGFTSYRKLTDLAEDDRN